MLHFDLDQRVKEIDLPQIRPLEYYQHERSKKHPRKRRAIYPTFMPEIRIMRHDIRRKYGEMFANVTNYHNLALFKGFFDDFFRPDCPIIKVSPSNNEVDKNILFILFDGKTRESISIKEFLQIKDASFRMVPDQILRLQECQVRTRQGSQGSVILMKGVLKGTKVLSAYPLRRNQGDSLSSMDEKQVDSLCSNSPSISSSSSSDEGVSPLSSMSLSVSSSPLKIQSDGDKNDRRYYLELAAVPLESVAAVAIIMVLDENHYIRQFFVEYRCISEAPVSIIN